MNKKITTCLWFNGASEDAAKFYATVFDHSGIRSVLRNTAASPAGPEGSVLTVSFYVEDMDFLALNGGSMFSVNPSISFFVHCADAGEVNRLWEKLSKGGKIMMPIDAYPFSQRYGWVQDQFGVSWQLIIPQQPSRQKVVPCMLFVNESFGNAGKALDYYVSVFKNASIGFVSHYGEGHSHPNAINYGECTLENQQFVVMENADKNDFQFNEGISFVIHCKDQDELDAYWNKLTSDGGQEGQCGWLKDKFGVSWQVTPEILPRLLQQNDREKANRTMRAMIQMKKLDIAGLEAGLP